MSRNETQAPTQESVDPESLRTRIEQAGSRRLAELAAMVCVGLLAVVMIGFVTVEWLRLGPASGLHPLVDSLYAITGVDGVAAAIFGQYLLVGQWLDFYLGTNVFRHAFMWRSVATGVLVGIVGPLVGTFLVHRQMALIGETLAHTAFAGVAVGLLFIGITGWNGSLLIIALIVSVLGALAVQWLTERTHTFGDVPIAIMLTGSFAVGTLLISWGRDVMTVSIDIEGYLFGSLAVVTTSGSRMMSVLSVCVVAIVAATYKQLLFITFDEQAARVAQLRVNAYNTLLIVMTAVVVVGAMQILGVILVAGMLVIPVAAASQVANSFRETMYLSIIVGQSSILGGFGFAVSQGLPSGGSIILIAIMWYLVAIVVSDRSGTALSMH